MPKVSTSKKQYSYTDSQHGDYAPSSRKGNSGGSAKGKQSGHQKPTAIPFGSGEASGGKLHDSPVAWPLRGEDTKYNKATKFPIVKTTVVGSTGLR